MERPLGPRAPPVNDRNRAFESIFGRPSAVHHIPPPGQQRLPPQAGYNNLQPPAGEPYARAPSPLGYLNYAPSQQAAGQQFRHQQDPRYPYGPPLQPSQQLQNPYTTYPPNQGQPRINQYPQPSEGYPGDVRQAVVNQSSGYGPGPTYAQSLPPEEFQPPPSVRHSITYRSGVTANRNDFGDRGYQSTSISAAPPPQQGGMTPAQAYQAQVLRDDPRLDSSYAEMPSGAAPPRTFNGRSMNGAPSTNAHLMRPQSMARLGSSQQSPPSLPPVDSAELLDIDDVLEGPRKHSFCSSIRLECGPRSLVPTHLGYSSSRIFSPSWLC